jgi:translation initiation factor IF-2
LKPHSHIISNLASARVRQMTDAAGKIVKAALPGMAVNVSGWREIPNSGDEVLEGEEGNIKRALANRRKRNEHQALMLDAEAINEQRHAEREKKQQAERDAEYFAKTGLHIQNDQEKTPSIKELRLVIKGDVSGSVEAVSGALEGIGNHQAKVKIVSTGVGEVCESDISLARAIDGETLPNFCFHRTYIKHVYRCGGGL